MTRRKWLVLAGAGVAGLVGLRFLVPSVMRSRAPRAPSAAAAAFAEHCFAGLDRSKIWDAHAHLIGLGAGGTGCRIDPDMLTHLHPIKRFQLDVYKAGAGITDAETADADFVARLLTLQRAANPRGRVMLLALDDYVAEDGTVRPELSPLHTPNDYTLRVAGEHAELEACGSVHPYRVDAIERLDRVAEGGARAIKWIPNAMGIDPASPRCDAFFRRLAELGLPLLTHAGKEYAVDAGSHQDFGDPMRLRRALDAGVRVIVAHCASMGSYGGAPSFDLFMELFTDDRYARNLFADISTLVHVHHGAGPLVRLLKTPELHERLLYGSDYPMCALRFFVMPVKLGFAGLIDPEVRGLCDELFDVNPLLFDFAVNRSLRVVEDGRTYRFSPAVFETARILDRDFSSPASPPSPADA